jgi:hypothetical protein
MRVGGTKKHAAFKWGGFSRLTIIIKSDDEEVGDITSRPSSCRTASSSAATTQMRRLAEEDDNEHHESDTDKDVAMRPARSSHTQSLWIVDSDEEDGEDEEESREQEEEQEAQEDVGIYSWSYPHIHCLDIAWCPVSGMGYYPKANPNEENGVISGGGIAVLAEL